MPATPTTWLSCCATQKRPNHSSTPAMGSFKSRKRVVTAPWSACRARLRVTHRWSRVENVSVGQDILHTSRRLERYSARGLGAAIRTAARSRQPNGRSVSRTRHGGGLAGTDERAHDPASHLTGEHLGLESCAGQEGPGVLELVDARGLDVDLLEARLPQERVELLL